MGSCLGCLYSCFCCECNFIVFPAPSPSYDEKSSLIKNFRNRNDINVPYLELLTPKSQINIIYFHGNAQDIGYSVPFLSPIQEELSANIFAIQYPTYGTYHKPVPMRLSNNIKKDSLDFYEHLKKIYQNISSNNTVILGRSIGSGGACYLASRKNLRNLILISPFSTIPNVAKDIVGCAGSCIKCHFNNIEELREYYGNLLIIHGKVDEVIHFKHGEMLVNQYEHRQDQEYHQKCHFHTPNNMSHNYFDYQTDILRPIKIFINQNIRPMP